MGEEELGAGSGNDADTTDGDGNLRDEDSLDQPEDEATEHALRLMNEALRRGDAGRRWLVAGDS
jgi:hypothetical protein